MPSLLILFVLSLAVASSPRSTLKRNGKSSAVEISTISAATAPDATAPDATAPDAAAPDAAPVIATIKEAARDLQMPSETDAAMRVEFWASDKSEISPAQIALLAAAKPENPVETQSVEQFFAHAVIIEDWMSDDEKATAKRFQNLVEVLNADLENPRVYLFGERERTVVIIGKVKGGFGGVVTLVVET